MDWNIEVRVDDGIVRTAIKGEVGFARGGRAIALATRSAAEAGSTLLLFDITQAVQKHYHAITVEHARRARESGIMKFRIAILGVPGDAKLSYMENVAINRGIRARAFTSEADAVAWLHMKDDARAATPR